MKNFEKYQTAKERYTAFCGSRCECSNCKFNSECNGDFAECALRWLDLEAEEEEILPCPFCGDECACGGGYVECLNDNCCYSSGNRKRSDAVAIAAHNRVARAAMKEKEEYDDQ